MLCSLLSLDVLSVDWAGSSIECRTIVLVEELTLSLSPCAKETVSEIGLIKSFESSSDGFERDCLFGNRFFRRQRDMEEIKRIVRNSLVEAILNYREYNIEVVERAKRCGKQIHFMRQLAWVRVLRRRRTKNVPSR